jgi:hypothetical protein
MRKIEAMAYPAGNGGHTIVIYEDIPLEMFSDELAEQTSLAMDEAAAKAIVECKQRQKTIKRLRTMPPPAQ